MPELQTDPVITPAGEDLLAGLFETDTVAVPDFNKMKKPDLIAYYDQNATPVDETEDLSYEEFSKLKVAGMKSLLKQLFPDPDALDGADVTGFNPSDPIHAAVAEAQALGDESKAIQAVFALQDAAQFNFFKVGAVLAEMQSNGWMGEYDDFWKFVEGTFGYRVRKGQTLVKIYHKLLECGATWEEAKKIGWSKLMVIAQQLTPDNYQDWFEKVDGATMATIQEMVKDHKADVANGNDGDINDLENTPIKRLTFSIHEDQEPTIKESLAKARAEGNTEFDGNALEIVATYYLLGEPVVGKSGERPNLRALIQEYAGEEDGAQAVLGQFCEVWPEAEVVFYEKGKPELATVLSDLCDEYGVPDVTEVLGGITGVEE